MDENEQIFTNSIKEENFDNPKFLYPYVEKNKPSIPQRPKCKLEYISQVFTSNNQEPEEKESDSLYMDQENQRNNISSEESKINPLEKDSDISQKMIYTCNDIKRILLKNEISNSLIEKIKDEYISKEDKQSFYIFNIKNKNHKKEKSPIKEKKLLGRKRNSDTSEGKHNKNGADNIIKKCKGILFRNVVDYISAFIKKYRTNQKENFELLKLDYGKYINNLKKENELDLFNMTLKDLASLEPSKKYSSNKDPEFNKKTISNLLKEEEKNSDKIIENFLNMRFGEWIDIFTLKNKIDHDFEFNGFHDSLESISNEFDEEYFSRFVFYLYNYKNWFKNKKGRNVKKNNI